MAVEINVPKLGLTMEEAVLVSWAFEPGAKVEAEQIVLVLETDKVTYEMPSPGAGLLHPLVAPGEIIKVSQLVGYLAADQAELDKLAAEQPAAQVGEVQPAGEAETPAASTAPASSGEPAAPAASAAPAATTGGRVKASPLAKAMAKEHGLDLGLIGGTGPGGRVVRSDVVLALEQGLPAPAAAAAAPEDEMALSVAREIPISGVRKVVFKNMHASLQSQAQLTLHTEVLAEGLMAFRQELNQRYKKEGVKVSYNAIILKAVAQALRMHPEVNVSVDGEVIKVWRQIHIGVAMDLGDGLIVPKVRKPDQKGVKAISLALDDMVEKARNKSLMPDDLAGGTFTVTNLGAWDIDHFTPIVNPPESAILGVGRIVEKPVVKDGQVVAGPCLGLSLTIDHRIIDGAPGAAFLKTIKDYIEQPMLMLE